MSKFLLVEDVPSNQGILLNTLIGLKIVKMIRYSWLPSVEATEEYELEQEDVFSLTAGPLLIYFESGLVVGFGSQPSKSSVTLWVEKNEIGEAIRELTEEDEELFPIDAIDNKYSKKNWAELIGLRIESVKILIRISRSILYDDLPNEAGLLITMENSKRFILSHGLHDDSDDFSVIFESQINSGIRDSIQGL